MTSSPWQSTMNRFVNWLSNKFAQRNSDAEPMRRNSGAHRMPKPASKKLTGKNFTTTPDTEYSAYVGGEIIDGGPGKNVLIRNKYIREDSGTHETLKIVDDSLLDSDDEFGLDPYNTGRFDRAQSWNSSRSRK